ncbi:MAG: hypothetical protein ACFCU8_12120 [Thermosynechococcaceae cyanobacterium]
MKYLPAVMVVILSGVIWLSSGFAAQAAESSSQPYFLNELEPGQTVLVSPSFDGDLSLRPLWESLTELGEEYDIKEAKLLYSTWPNVREVPRLLVSVAPKMTASSTAVVADLGSAAAQVTRQN